MSLSATVTPCKGPRRRPAAISASAARAAARALSFMSVTWELRRASWASMRANVASTSSSDLSSRAAIIRAASASVRCVRSTMYPFFSIAPAMARRLARVPPQDGAVRTGPARPSAKSVALDNREGPNPKTDPPPDEADVVLDRPRD